MTRSSFSAGERKLPGAGAVLGSALLALSVGCQAQPTDRDAAPNAARSEAPLAVPTLGTKPPAGLVLPTYFAAITGSEDGTLTVLTSPGSRCTLFVARPSGIALDGGTATADSAGVARFTYAPLADRGRTIQTVTCTLNGATLSTSTELVRP